MDPFVLSRIDALVEVNKQWVTEFLPIEVQVKVQVREDEVQVVGEDEVQVLGEDEVQVGEGEVQVSDSDESTRIVNLADFIGTGMRSNRDDNCKHLRQYLPRRFNSNSPSSRKEQVIPFIAVACAQAGFKVASKGWEKAFNKLRFFCQHSRAHDDKKVLLRNNDNENENDNNHNNQFKSSCRSSKRIRPSAANKESICPFAFSLYWEPNDGLEDNVAGRWYFCADGTGCKSHEGHQKKDPADVRLSYHTVPPLELELSRQCISLNSEPAIVQALIVERTGISLSSDQLRRCSGTRGNQVGSDGTTSVDLGQSPAERLVHYLRNEESLDYILLVHDNTATRLLTITRTGRNRGSSSEHNHYCPRETDASTLSYAESVRKALGLSGNTKLLLGAAWASKQQKRMFGMFPETLCADVTMGTNAEKRPLLVMTAKTSENQIVRVFQAFLPSQCRWIFDWCFRDAFVQLHGSTSVERNQIILTDGDLQMYSPLVDLIGDRGSPWRNSKHMLCMWHLINRGLKHSHLSDGRLSALGKAQFAAVQQWMYSLSDYPETSDEFDISLKLLYKFLGSAEVVDPSAMGNVMAEALTNFVMTSIAQRKMSISFFTKLHIRCFNMRTTSNVESESSTIKKHPMGPRPFHGIDRSCVALSTILSRQMSRREVDAASALDYKSMRPQIVGDILTDYGSKLLAHQYNSRLCYLVTQISSDTFLLKRRYSSPGGDECDATSDSPKFDKVTPRFSRVREVRLVEHMYASSTEENMVLRNAINLECSCGYFSRFGITCRHVFSIISPHGHSFDFGTLSAYHASARWRKDYLYYHGKHDKLTFLYDRARDGERRGPYSMREKIDELWLLSSALEGPTVDNNHNLLHDMFLRDHNQNCTSVLLPGSKWGQPINDVPLESHEQDTFALSQDSISVMTAGCIQEVFISASSWKSKSDSSIALVGGTSVYSSNLALYTQVSTYAQGSGAMALELRRGLESLLSSFIQQRNRVESAATAQHEFASLPQVDKSRKNKRLGPSLSPQKRGKG